MAKVKAKTISWNPSPSSDVVDYYVRYKQVLDDSTVIAYNDPFISTGGNNSITAPVDFPAGTFIAETDYIIGVSAVDDQGNESDIREISHPFDFVPPEPVTGLTVS